MTSFDIVVACDTDLGIAKDGDLPWHLPSDLRHFRDTTKGTDDPAKQNAIFMGRTTWESLGPKYQPLPGRKNIVITRTRGYSVPQAVACVADIDSALQLAGDDPAIESVYCVGGGVIYGLAIEHPALRDIIVTRIDSRFGCDTFFPEFRQGFRLRSTLGTATENDLAYAIEVWRRQELADG